MHDILIANAAAWPGGTVPRSEWADVLLVREGRIAFVGRSREISAPRGIPVLDAGGRVVLPGFVDSHIHVLGTGFAMVQVQLKGVASSEEACGLVSAAAEGEGWIEGTGWDQHLWGGRLPSRYELDAVAPARPVVLEHTSAHALWVNSAALAACGITRETGDPPGGLIDRDEAGEPTGILRDHAMRLVYDCIPAASGEAKQEALSRAQREAHRLGITGIHAMDVSGGELTAIQEAHRAGTLRLRTRAYLAASRLERWVGMRTGDGDDMLRIGGVKFFADGALGSLTAWMDEPYEGTSGRGLPLQPIEELERDLRRCLEQGLAPAVHAIGDRANREVLDVLARSATLAPGLPRRIEHAQLLAAGLIERFTSLGVTASVQPIHATQDRAKVDRHWGRRGRWAYPFAELLGAGVNLAFGSDSPVESPAPYEGLFAAHFRSGWPGETGAPWYPEQRLTLEQALAGYTHGPARAAGEADQFGRLARGYAGDIVVLNGTALEDALGGPPAATIVAGEVVHSREDFEPGRALVPGG